MKRATYEHARHDAQLLVAGPLERRADQRRGDAAPTLFTRHFGVEERHQLAVGREAVVGDAVRPSMVVSKRWTAALWMTSKGMRRS